LNKAKGNEAKLEDEKRQLRMSLDDVDSRRSKGELGRRSQDGEIQRLKLALNDKEGENQVNTSL